MLKGIYQAAPNIVAQLTPGPENNLPPKADSTLFEQMPRLPLFDRGSFLKSALLKAIPSPAAVNQVGLNPAEEQTLAEQYAPIFYFHPNEEYFPGDPVAAIEGANPDSFSDNATVDGQFVTLQGMPATYTGTPPMEGLNIGDPIVLKDGLILVDESGNPVIHASQLSSDDYMKIQEKAPGDPQTAPIIYNYDQGPPPTMTYWMFSPYNNGYNNHQGDWEAVTITFGQNSDSSVGEPVSITFSGHGGGTTYPWEMVTFENGRPVVYVAEGSHAMSPFTDERSTKAPGLDDHWGAGERMDSATSLRRFEDESWYQHGGVEAHWGQSGDSFFVDLIDDGMNDGPTGPTPTDKNKQTDDRTEEEKKADELILKHVERDENGNIIRNEHGEPEIDEDALFEEVYEIYGEDFFEAWDVIIERYRDMFDH